MRSEVQVLLDPPYTSGALAQLVERLLCKQDVIGSNPIGSTKTHLADMIRQHLLVLSRPVGRGSSEPFNIVQRDNQRRRPHPREDVAGGSSELPAMTLSKSSTLTKSRYPCDIGGKSTCILVGRRVPHAQKVAVTARRKSFFFRIKSSAIRAFGGCLGSKRR